MNLRYAFVTRLALLIFLCTTLSACVTLPSSQRLEDIRTQRSQTLETQVTAHSFAIGSPVFVRVFKEEAQLELWMRDKRTQRYNLFKTYPICSYSGVLGPKLREGDKQAPEGFYTITGNDLNPWSQHHLSMNIGFPNIYDQAHGRTGSYLMIHGGCQSAGCYAMTDPAIEEIYLLSEASLQHGHNVPVHIFPFRMNDTNMTRFSNHGWMFFWQNLKQGYDAFERTKIPPMARHSGYKYVFKTQRFMPTTYYQAQLDPSKYSNLPLRPIP